MKKSKRTKPARIKEKALTLEEVFDQIALTSTSTPGLNSIVLTPLSSEACLRHGVNPDHLRKRNVEIFRDNDQTDLEIQRLKYETYERRRHEHMKLVSDEKGRMKSKRSPKEASLCDASMASSNSHARGSENASLTPSKILERQEKVNSTLLELEEKRLKKAKEKQKRELMQLLQFEQKMEKMQEDMRLKAEQEALAAEKKMARKQKQDQRDADERRLRELRRKAQEDAEEEIHRINARQRFEKERQFKKEKERQEMQNKRRLRQLEKERDKKREMQRVQTEKMQMKKREDIEKKMKEHEAKERERNKRIEKKRAVDQYELDKKREETARRIAMNKEAARKKEEERKEFVAEKRIKSEMKQQKIAMMKKKEKELAKKENEALSRKREWQAKLSREREEEVKAALLKKFHDNEANVNHLQELKEREMVLLKEEKELHTQLKRENVERIKRMQEYKRLETLRKVSEGDQRTESMLRKREELAKTRRKHAVQAKIRRDKLRQTLEKSKTSGGEAIKKILAKLSSDDYDVSEDTAPRGKKQKIKRKKKFSAPKVEAPQHQHGQDSNSRVPPSIIQIGPPPEAATLLARIGEKSEQTAPYVSPYAPSVQ